MSKRELRKYIFSLSKEHLEDQLITLYEKFPDVKRYYNFVFNPNEEKLLAEAKMKVRQEFFPLKAKRARMRRTVLQKFVRQFQLWGVDEHLIADLILFYLETAQEYAAKKSIRFDSFYKAMLTSYNQAMELIRMHQMHIYADRLQRIALVAAQQRWYNSAEFHPLDLHI